MAAQSKRNAVLEATVQQVSVFQLLAQLDQMEIQMELLQRVIVKHVLLEATQVQGKVPAQNVQLEALLLLEAQAVANAKLTQATQVQGKLIPAQNALLAVIPVEALLRQELLAQYVLQDQLVMAAQSKRNAVLEATVQQVSVFQLLAQLDQMEIQMELLQRVIVKHVLLEATQVQGKVPAQNVQLEALLLLEAQAVANAKLTQATQVQGKLIPAQNALLAVSPRVALLRHVPAAKLVLQDQLVMAVQSKPLAQLEISQLEELLLAPLA